MLNKLNLETQINRLNYSINQNNIYIKREDLIPFSFGGNKARKSYYFFNEIEKQSYNYVITYGSSSSNHCRIVANLCKKKNLGCTIISTENGKNTFNRNMCNLFGAELVICDTNQVKDTIDYVVNEKKKLGYNPYFIQGGGHGNLGTQAYVDAYNEIIDFENKNNLKFDYIFHASGTGTTQAGLVIGSKIRKHNTQIIGISIARKLPYGRNVILDSIREYDKQYKLNIDNIEEIVNFIDDYIVNGYGTYNEEIKDTVINMLRNEGISLDFTYTGKAFWGMNEYIKKQNIKDKNILFIHTGGTPIFFDNLKELIK